MFCETVLVESGLNLAILDSKHKVDGSQILILQKDYKPKKNEYKVDVTCMYSCHFVLINKPDQLSWCFNFYHIICAAPVGNTMTSDVRVS